MPLDLCVDCELTLCLCSVRDNNLADKTIIMAEGQMPWRPLISDYITKMIVGDVYGLIVVDGNVNSSTEPGHGWNVVVEIASHVSFSHTFPR